LWRQTSFSHEDPNLCTLNFFSDSLIETIKTFTTSFSEETSLVFAVYVLAESIGTLLSWIRLLYYFRALNIGPLVTIILRMFSDIGKFIIFFGFIWLGFADVLVIFLSKNPYQTLWYCLMVLFGDHDEMLKLIEEIPIGSIKFFLTFLFLFYCFVVIILLVNLLIAMMNQSYEKIMENAQVEGLILRDTLISECQYLIHPKDFNKKYYLKKISCFFSQKVKVMRSH